MKLNKSSIRKRLFLFTILGVMVLLFFVQFYTAKNYSEPNYPYYSGNYAVENPKSRDVINVISYNIWFGEDIDQALLELKEIESQKVIDIILLQEMDEVGTEQIARELQLNYVYFPAAIEPTYDKNFGNAILTRWPIVASQKLILPHRSFSNRMNRIATRATIRIGATDILVYSIHSESIFTVPRFRKDQYTAVLDDIDSEMNHIIVGGDFNTFFERDVQQIEEDFGDAGFMRASKGSGYTIVRFGMEMPSDHIFVKGFAVEDAGKLTGATASDHLPIWVTLRLK